MNENITVSLPLEVFDTYREIEKQYREIKNKVDIALIDVVPYVLKKHGISNVGSAAEINGEIQQMVISQVFGV